MLSHSQGTEILPDPLQCSYRLFSSLSNQEVVEDNALYNAEPCQGPDSKHISGYRNQHMNAQCTKIIPQPR